MTKEEYTQILAEMDFMKDACNVYRTEHYIIRQELSIEVIDAETVVYSKDTFFKRTKRRDAQFRFVYSFKDEKYKGKRVPATMTTRTYVD